MYVICLQIEVSRDDEDPVLAADGGDRRKRHLADHDHAGRTRRIILHIQSLYSSGGNGMLRPDNLKGPSSYGFRNSAREIARPNLRR